MLENKNGKFFVPFRSISIGGLYVSNLPLWFGMSIYSTENTITLVNIDT